MEFAKTHNIYRFIDEDGSETLEFLVVLAISAGIIGLLMVLVPKLKALKSASENAISR